MILKREESIQQLKDTSRKLFLARIQNMTSDRRKILRGLSRKYAMILVVSLSLKK